MHHKYPFITGRVTIQHFHERRIDKYLPIINPPRVEKKRREGKPQIVPKNEQSEIKERVYYISHKNSSNRVGKKKIKVTKDIAYLPACQTIVTGEPYRDR